MNEKNKNSINNKERGITLIALILTIIILVILAAVTINAVTNMGIVGRAVNGAQDYARAAVEENKMLYDTASYIENALGIVQLQLKPGERAKGIGYTYEGIPIPAGFTVSGIAAESESVEKGIVIYDIPENELASVDWEKAATVNGITCPEVQTKYNQFVWVPVENAYVTADEITSLITNNASITNNQQAINYLINENGIYPMAVKLSNGNYRGIAYNFNGTESVTITAREFSINPNESYEIKYKTLDNASDTTVYKTYYREPGMVCYDFGIGYQSTEPNYYTLSTPVNTIGLTLNTLQTEYNQMVESVASNKGFYVARYELGYNTQTNKGESKRAQTVAAANNTNTYRWYGLYTACKNIYTEKVQSMMISGSQYDQMMIWMKDVANGNKKYITDSTGKGIYKVGGTDGTLSKSGSNDSYIANQVYDLGGNYWEWTSEANSTDFRALRGGSYSYEGASYPASYRSNSNPSGAYSDSSGRSALYLK